MRSICGTSLDPIRGRVRRHSSLGLRRSRDLPRAARTDDRGASARDAAGSDPRSRWRHGPRPRALLGARDELRRADLWSTTRGNDRLRGVRRWESPRGREMLPRASPRRGGGPGRDPARLERARRVGHRPPGGPLRALLRTGRRLVRAVPRGGSTKLLGRGRARHGRASGPDLVAPHLPRRGVQGWRAHATRRAAGPCLGSGDDAWRRT